MRGRLNYDYRAERASGGDARLPQLQGQPRMIYVFPRRNRGSRTRVTAAIIGLLSAASLAVTGCGAQGVAAADDGRLQVLTSFYPLQFVAEEVCGDLCQVTNLTPPAADPHNLELSLARANQISTTDLMITLSGFQPAVDDAVAQRNPRRLVDAADFVSLIPATLTGATEHSHDHGSDDHGHDDEDDYDDEYDESVSYGVLEDNDGHDHSGMEGYDPHFWLNPIKLAELAEPVAAALSDADPANAEVFENRAAELRAQLEELDAEFEAQLYPLQGALLVTNHTSFGYLAKRYGLEQVGITGLDHDVEPSPARMREISELARAHNVKTIFYETLVSPRVAQTLAGDLGINTAVLDPLEGLRTEDADAGENYFTIMRQNLAKLVNGLNAP